MSIEKLKIPIRIYGESTPVAPDTNAEVAKINELVDAVNAGLATSNAIVGGPKYVQYLSSQTYGVPADSSTLDRLTSITIIPGTTAIVLNPAPTPLVVTATPKEYVATIVATGGVQVPRYIGAPVSDTVGIEWVEVVSNDTFTPLLKSELNAGKAAYADLDLRPLLIALVNGIGTGSSTVITTPAPGQVVTGPMVTGFLPDSAEVGASVTLTGTGFTKATAVLFNGTPASFQAVNATTIVAVVPVGATTGALAVTNSAGTGTSTASFTVKAGAVTPTPGPALTAALAISVASIVAGSTLTFTVTAGGGTAPYSYQVVATNNATGATTVLGGSPSGSWTPQAAGSYNIDATVTDAVNKVAQAITRTVQVTSAANVLPTASAGDDVVLQLPTNSVGLLGTGTDSDGTITAYSWSQITGPSTVAGLPTSAQNVTVSGLVAGIYQFRLTVTDDKGGTKTDDVLVTVNAAAGGGVKPTRLLVTGNSLDAVQPGTTGGYYSPSGTWAQKAVVSINAGWSIETVAVNGQTSSHILNVQVPDIIQRHQAANGTYTDIAFVGSPVNDWIVEGRTWEYSFANIKAACQQLKAAGMLVVMGTMTDDYNDQHMQPLDYIQSNIVAFNTAIRAATAPAEMGYNSLIYWAEDARLQGHTSQDAVSQDGLHFNEGGTSIKAEIAVPVLLNLPAASAQPVAAETFRVENVSWTDLLAATATGNDLTFQTTCSAHSSRVIGPSSKAIRGYLEFTLATLNTDTALGLNDKASDNNGVDISLSIHMSTGGVRAFGTIPGYNKNPTGAVVGDVVRVTIAGTQLIYTKNGVEFDRITSSAIPAGPLQVDLGAFADGSVSNVKIAGWNLANFVSAANTAVAKPVVWTGLTGNTTADGANLNIGSSGSGASAYIQQGMGATTDNLIGFYGFTMNDMNAEFIIGLTINPGGSTGFSDHENSQHILHGNWRPFGSKAGYNIQSAAFAQGSKFLVRIYADKLVYLINGGIVGETAGTFSPGNLYLDVSGLTAGTITDVQLYAANPVG